MIPKRIRRWWRCGAEGHRIHVYNCPLWPKGETVIVRCDCGTLIRPTLVYTEELRP